MAAQGRTSLARQPRTAARSGTDASENATILAFNRGRISELALSRVDVKRYAFSAETQTNLPPRVLGSMSLRPGLQYLFPSASSGAAKYLPAVFSNTDKALVEITATGIRFSVSDAIITRIPSNFKTIANGSFTTDLTSWTDFDESGATSAFYAGGGLSLTGTGFSAAIRSQLVTVDASEKGSEHGVKFTIARGPVTLKIGSSSRGAEYISEKVLNTGTYSFVFTPTGDYYIELAGRTQAASIVTKVVEDSGGDFTLPSPYAASDLSNIRYDTSADVIFIACAGHQQRRLERFDSSSKSWGISLYAPDDGPLRGINTTSITLTPSGLTGDITLTASRSFFNANHVGGLFAITSVGQKVTTPITAENQFTDDSSLRIVGVENTRIFTITIAGTFSATVTLQRSIDEAGSWVDVTSYTTTQAGISFDDGLDNQIAYYRIGVKTGDFTSQTGLVVTLEHASGGFLGVARVTGYTGPTVVDAAVLNNFGSTGSSLDWQEGSWSTHRGFPQALSFYEGRLWHVGKGNYYGSITDAFTSFDEDFEGDAGVINRSIGSGPVDNAFWLLPLQRLLTGTAAGEVSARSTSFDEVLTPDNFNLKNASTQGSANVNAVVIDSNGVFVQRSGTRVYEESFNFESNDYAPTDLTDAIPEIGEPGIIRMAVQRQPDTRLHCVRSDGTVAMLVREPDNDVLAWIDIETDGLVEDVVVLPGTTEDQVYYHVNRTINGSTVRYLERWALESEARGGTLNKMADSFLVFTHTVASATVTGLAHLEAESVVCWTDGICLRDTDGAIATFTVTSGAITLTNNGSAYLATTGVVGLAYQGRFKSTKLDYASRLGTALTQRKRLAHLGLVMAYTHYQGVKFGPDFTVMDNLPLIDDKGAETAVDTIHTSYEKDMFDWPGGWGVDERVCLEMNAPRPATILGVVVGIEENDKS